MIHDRVPGYQGVTLISKKIAGTKHLISPGALKSDDYQGAFSEIVIKDDSVNIDMHYFDEAGEYSVLHIRK